MTARSQSMSHRAGSLLAQPSDLRAGIINCHPDPRDQGKSTRLRNVLLLIGVAAIIVAHWIFAEL